MREGLDRPAETLQELRQAFVRLDILWVGLQRQPPGAHGGLDLAVLLKQTGQATPSLGLAGRPFGDDAQRLDGFGRALGHQDGQGAVGLDVLGIGVHHPPPGLDRGVAFAGLGQGACEATPALHILAVDLDQALQPLGGVRRALVLDQQGGRGLQRLASVFAVPARGFIESGDRRVDPAGGAVALRRRQGVSGALARVPLGRGHCVCSGRRRRARGAPAAALCKTMLLDNPFFASRPCIHRLAPSRTRLAASRPTLFIAPGRRKPRGALPAAAVAP